MKAENIERDGVISQYQHRSLCTRFLSAVTWYHRRMARQTIWQTFESGRYQEATPPLLLPRGLRKRKHDFKMLSLNVEISYLHDEHRRRKNMEGESVQSKVLRRKWLFRKKWKHEQWSRGSPSNLNGKWSSERASSTAQRWVLVPEQKDEYRMWKEKKENTTKSKIKTGHPIILAVRQHSLLPYSFMRQPPPSGLYFWQEKLFPLLAGAIGLKTSSSLRICGSQGLGIRFVNDSLDDLLFLRIQDLRKSLV
jgi:hypothetical protein